MNRIVREHYPVDKLPEDLRNGLPTGQTVTVTVESEAAESDLAEKIDQILRNPKPATFAEARKLAGPRTTTGEEAVARIRALRDEWDD